MSNILEPILAELDVRIVYAVVALLAILVIISIVKKALKIAIVVAVIAAIIYFLAPMSKEFQEKYQFDIQSGVAYIKSEGQNFVIDKVNDIKEVKMTYNGVQGVDLEIKYDDGLMNITIPVFLNDKVKDFLDDNNIKYKIE